MALRRCLPESDKSEAYSSTHTLATAPVSKRSTLTVVDSSPSSETRVFCRSMKALWPNVRAKMWRQIKKDYVLWPLVGGLAGLALGTGFVPALLVKLICLALIWAYLHHFIAGVRHLWMDATHSVSKQQGHSSAVVTLALSVLLTLACVAILATKGLALGLDFTGGILLEFRIQTLKEAHELNALLTAPLAGVVELHGAGVPPAVMVCLVGGGAVGAALLDQRIGNLAHTGLGDTAVVLA